MNTDCTPFEEAILVKAKELKIHPLLLSIAIEKLSEHPQTDNASLFCKFGSELIRELRRSTQEKIGSLIVKERKAAHKALQELGEPLNGFLLSKLPGVPYFGNCLIEGEVLLNLHNKAWNILIDEWLQIKRLYSRKLDLYDPAQIIKALCSNEIELYKKESQTVSKMY